MTITINLGQADNFTQPVWPTIFSAIANALEEKQPEESAALIEKFNHAAQGFQEKGIEYVIEQPQFNKVKIDFTDDSEFSYTMALPDENTKTDNPSAYTAHASRMYDYVLFNLEERHSQNETQIIFDPEQPDYLLLQIDNAKQAGSQARSYY